MMMKNPEATWDKTSFTTFGYRNDGVRSRRYRYIVYDDGTEELHDHGKDQWEWQNLVDNPEHADVNQEMRQGIPAHHEPPGELSARKANALEVHG